tara:strand:- start:1121 stop:1801 length:681 start_codon:yes stop_codon:yes gene_type:complete
LVIKLNCKRLFEEGILWRVNVIGVMRLLSESVVSRVNDGHPIVYPTSNLPALGCIPSEKGLNALFNLKKRPEHMKVSLAVADLAQAREIVEVTNNVEKLLSDFPLGAITIILPAHERLDDRIGGGDIAIRVINTEITKKLLKRVGPLTATSANISGVEPEFNCKDAALALGLGVDSYIPGNCSGEPPSTLIRCNDYATLTSGEQLQVLREGIVSKLEVKSWLMKTN